MGTPLKSEPIIPSAPPKENAQDKPQPQMKMPEDLSPVRANTTIPVKQDELQDRNERIATGTILSPEERAKKKARLATILDRGVVQDRLHVKLPPDVYGEWVRDDPLEIQRLRTVGFEIDREFASSQSLHDDGSGAARVADVVFMTCRREDKELIDEIRHEQMMKLHAPKKAREEQELAANVRTATDGIIPTFTESESRTARRDDIAAALREADAQIQPATTKTG